MRDANTARLGGRCGAAGSDVSPRLPTMVAVNDHEGEKDILLYRLSFVCAPFMSRSNLGVDCVCSANASTTPAHSSKSNDAKRILFAEHAAL